MTEIEIGDKGLLMISESTISEIKIRLTTSDVIGKYVKLKKKGREFIGLSPFTREKTPSFSVNDDKEFFHCFSANKTGDIIQFIMEIEGYSFKEAVEHLADIAGVEILDDGKVNIPDTKEIKEALSWAEGRFQKNLMASESFQAREYLRNRGFSKDEVKEFGIGFAPDSFEFLNPAQKDLKDCVRAGIIVRGDNGKHWDRFRNRIMFPIRDSMGRTVGFGGRTLGDKDAKYLNSSDGPTFNKSKLLYNFDKARKHILEPDTPIDGLVVVEGYTDVVSLWRSGVKYAVAPMGTAITVEQLHLLWKVGCCPVLCLDGDKAGIQAAFRAVNTAIKYISEDRTLKFCMLPHKQDPDEFIKEHGKDEFKKLLLDATPFHEFIWDMVYSECYPMDTPEKKSGFKRKILSLVNEIDDEYVRRDYRGYVFEQIKKMNGQQKETAKMMVPLMGESPWDIRLKKNLNRSIAKSD